MSILKCNYNNGSYALKFNWKNNDISTILTEYISDTHSITLPLIPVLKKSNSKVKLYKN